MKKIHILFAVLFLAQFAVNAQILDEKTEKMLKDEVKTDSIASWKTGGLTNVNIAQTSLVNWAAGGQNSLALNGLVSLFATYSDQKNVWENTLDLGYGVLKEKGNKSFLKTDDRIDFLSKYGRKAFSNFYYSGLVNFKTQFAAGYNYPDVKNKISSFMAPGYLLASAGLNYIPNNYFNVFFSPATSKTIFVFDEDLSNMGAFGVEKGKNVKQEFGAYLRAGFAKNDFKDDFLKNISITSKLDLFSNYLNNPQYIDVNWENILGMKVNDYISITLNTNLIYDYDTKSFTKDDVTGNLVEGKAKVQFKEILGVGFMYKF